MPYIGQRPSKGDENNFKILDDISSYTLTFDGSDAAVVSAANDTITSLNHRFVQGQRVTYNKGGGTVITGLSDGVYYIIKHDHHNIKLATSASNASNGIAVNITNVGSGSSHTLNAAFDGINTKFKATHTNGQKAKITRSAQLVISMNGVIQQPHDTATPSTGFGFDLDGTIVFSQAPVSTDAYWAHVLTNNNVTFDISDNDVDNFTGNGSTVSFNLSKTPPDNRNVLVTVDGVVQYPNDPDGTVRAYTVVENVLTFTTAPATGTEIQVRHIGFAGSTSGGGGGVTNFYGRTGSVVLKNTDDVTVNDAAVTGDLTVTGNLTVNGTTTTLDTQLVEVDKIEVETAGTNVAVAVTHNGSGDLIRLYDGTSQVVTVDDTGKVGIGSETPNAKLRVHNGSDDSAIVWLSGADSFSEYLSLGIQPGLAVLRGGGTGSTSTALSFETSTSGTEGEKMRLDANGILKLGTGLSANHVNNAPSDVKFFLNSGRGDYGGLATNAVIFDNQTAGVDKGGTLTLAGFTGSTAIAKAAIRGGNEGSSSTNNGYFAVFTRPTSGSLGERLRINSTGQIITNGTANPFPTRGLTLRPVSGQTNNYLSIIAGNTSSVSGVTFGTSADNNANNYRAMFEYYHSAFAHNEGLRFLSAGTEALRIRGGTEAGDILYGSGDHHIGASPGLINALGSHHNNNPGSVLFGINDGGGYNGMKVINFDDGTYNSQRIEFLTGKGGYSMATVRMGIDENGLVSIGRTISANSSFNASTNQLVVGNGVGSQGMVVYTGASHAGSLIFNDVADGTFQGGLSYKHGSGSGDNSLKFYANAGERARINSTGQLIVGSTSSNAEAGTNTRLSVCATGSPGTNPSSILNNVIATFRATGAAGHAGSIAVLAGNDGSSAIHFGDTDNDIIGRIIYNHTSGNATDYMSFYVQGNERLQISAGGVLGVRTTPAVWHTDRRAIQLGGASLSGQNPADGQELSLTNNAFYDSADNRWEFIADDDANGIFMSNGGISFKRSPSSGTAGNVLNWATSLQINDTGYVQTKSELWVGGSLPVLRWRDTTHGEKATARIGGSDLYFEVNNSEKLRIKSGTNPVEIKNFTGIGLHMSGGGDPTLQISDTDGTNQHVMLAHNGGDSYIVTRNNTSHGVFRIYSQDGTDTLTRIYISQTGNLGVGNVVPTFSTLGSVSGSNVRGIEIFQDGTDTASALKLAGDNGSGNKAFSQLGYSGANATAHWGNYNTSGTLQGQIVIGSTGNVSLGQVDTSSSSALHIRSNTSTETTLELSTKGNYNGSLPDAKISFTQQNGTEIARIKCDTNTGAANMADLVFWTNFGGLAERLRITKSGHLVTGAATPPNQAASDGSVFLKNDATLGFLSQGGSLTFNAYYNGGWKYVSNGAAHIMWGDSGGINFSLGSSGTAGNTISFSRALKIHTNNRISIGDGNNTTPLAALHINTKAQMGTDTALFIGSNSDNRYMLISQTANSEQFSHMELRFNDNGRRNLLYLSNPYGPAGYGSGILWRGYNNGTQAYIETASEGANSANSTMKIYSSGNSGIDITHNSGVYIREPTSSRGVHITGHSSAQNNYESGYIQATSTGTYANIDIAPKGTRGQINFGGHGSQSIYLLVEGGSIDGNQTLTFDYSWYPGGAGGLKISAWASHWTSQYNLIRDAYVFGDSYAGMTEEVIKSKSSTEQGAWTFSRPSNHKFRIEKSAGTYGGGMNYCIMIWHPGNSMTLRRDT